MPYPPIIQNLVLPRWEVGLTNNQIIKETGLSRSQIFAVLNRKNLKANKYPKLQLEGNLLQLVLGSMLGDGSITKPGKFQAGLQIAHKVDHKEYLQQKVCILKACGLDNTIYYYESTSDRYINGYREVRMKSKTHPIFTYLRHLLYGKGSSKHIVPHLFDQLEPLGLAIWYMDDGNVTTYSYTLNTQSFSQQEKEYLRDLLRDSFKISATLPKNGTIYILAESCETFFNIIKPHVPPIMEYKLIPYAKRS